MTADWKPVCALSEVPSDTPMAARVDGHRLVLVRRDDGSIAIFDDACPHEGFPLSKGTVSGGELVCPWHNFRFSLRNGACRKGDEDALPLPVQVDNGTVYVDLTPPPVEERRARLEASLTAATLDRRNGQVARDLVRLLRLGVSTDELLARAIWLDARHAEWGTSHVFPLAADVRERAKERAAVSPTEAAYVLAPVYALVSESHVRRSPRVPPPPGTVPDDLTATLRELLAQEDELAFEATVRAAVLEPLPLQDIQDALIACASDHLLSFGHPLIYISKLMRLPPMPNDWKVDVLGTLAFRFATATKEDGIPAWSGFHRWMASVGEAHSASAAGSLEGDVDALHAAFENARAIDALTGLHTAAMNGLHPDLLCQVLVRAASERILRFDCSIDADPTLQDGWLDITHRLTTAIAVAQVRHRLSWTDWLRMYFTTAFWVHRCKAADLPAAPPSTPATVPTPAELARQIDRALNESTVRSIFLAHHVKTIVAAAQASTVTGDPAPWQAALHFVDSPLREARGASQVGDAIRLVVDGKVPRTRT